MKKEVNVIIDSLLNLAKKTRRKYKPESTSNSSLEDEIRNEAYHKWVHAGRPHGRDLEFWHEAEKQILEQYRR